jgi:hypothetical protein
VAEEEALLVLVVVVVLLDVVLVEVVFDLGAGVLPGILGGVLGTFSDGNFTLPLLMAPAAGVGLGVVPGGAVVLEEVVVVVVGVCAITGVLGLAGEPCCNAA